MYWLLALTASHCRVEPRPIVSCGQPGCNDAAQRGETHMYQTLSEFLRTFSVDSPILWAFLVVGAIVGTSLALYTYWEVFIKGLSVIFSKSSDLEGDIHR